MNKDDMLIERIEGLKELIEEKFKTNAEQHERIEIQTSRTNGRVNNLEAWQNKIIGGLVISQIIVIPMMAWLVSLHVK